MNRPQSILIFLPDGSPRSVRIAEITNRVVKAILIPRNKLDYIGERDEVKDDGFVVFKASEVSKTTVPSCHEYLITLRSKLLNSGVLKEQGEVLIFEEDYIFNSPSTAGGVVLGRSTNGWKKWKNTAGKTLDELKRT